MTIYYIDPSWTGTASGTLAQPWTSFSSVGATFSLVSGTIYNRTFTKAQINSGSTGVLEYISAVSIASDAFLALGSMLRLNTATPTTPGVGEYGFTGADPVTLYVNLGVANTSYPAMYVYPDIGNVLIEGCEVSYTKWRTVECFALYIDDSMPATVRDCWVHHNENRGIMVHRGTGCKIYGNVVENNATYGIAVTGGMNTLIYNNIIRNNLSNGIQLGTVSTGCEVRNNIIEGNVIGISGMTDTVASNNCFYNNSSSNITGFTSAGGDITAVPGIVSNRIVDTSSNLYYSGTHVGYIKGADNNQFNNPPSIGAYEYVRPREARV